MQIFFALDGTADVTQRERCERAALVGRFTRVCCLPPGADPDDLDAAALEAVKSDSRPVLTEYLEYASSLQGSERAAALGALGKLLAQWAADAPALSGDLRAESCAALGITEAEYQRWTGERATEPTPAPAAADSSGSPPLKVLEDEPSGDGQRPEISNYEFRKVAKTGADGSVKYENVAHALTLDVVRDRVHAALGGDICALEAPGAKQPILFVPTKRGIKWLPTPLAIETFCGDRGIVRWNSRQDKTGQNYVRWEQLHQSFGLSDRVRRFKAVECYPHEPPMKDHCYVWRPPADYPEPDGRYILELIKLFDNIVDPYSKAIFAASIVSPCWGGPCGERVAFAFVADLPGSGKGKAAEAVGKPYGGLLETQMDDKAEERLVQRLLHESGLSKRVVRLDNVKDALDSSLLEALITWPAISGHKLGFGQAERPNNIVVLITANGIRVSNDMARRIFFVRMKRPEKKPLSWNERYRKLVDENGDKIVADALAILKSAPNQNADFEDTTESFGYWGRDVLAKVVGYPAFKEVLGGLTVKDVLEANDQQRVDVDEVREQAELFMDGLVAIVAKENNMVMEVSNEFMARTRIEIARPTAAIFRPTQQLAKDWLTIFGKKEIDWRWVGRKLNEHIRAGRIKEDHFSRMRNETKTRRGFEIKPAAFEAYFREYEVVEAGASEIAGQ